MNNLLKRVLVFDGNHLAHRAYYKFANLKTLDGSKTSIIYGLVYILESVIRRLGPDEVIVTFDGGHSNHRVALLPGYKQREKKLGFDYDDFIRQKETAKETVKCLGIKVAHKKGYEADDIITMIARRYSVMGWETIIVSGDKDFNQLLMPSNFSTHGAINIFNTNKGKLIEPRTLTSFYPYTPNQCVDFLSLTGDDSDKIPGYRGLGEIKSLELINEFGGVRKFLKSDKQFGKVNKDLLKEVYNRNRQLIDLKWYYRKYLLREEIPYENPKPLFDFLELKRICSLHEVNTFLKPQFIQTFKNLYHG